MSVKIISKHVKVTEAIREKIESKFEKLEKYIIIYSQVIK